MYLSKFLNVFVQISKCICPNCKIYLSKFLKVFVIEAKCHFRRDTLRTPFCTSSNCKVYLSQFLNVFLLLAKCICHKSKINATSAAEIPLDTENPVLHTPHPLTLTIVYTFAKLFLYQQPYKLRT